MRFCVWAPQQSGLVHAAGPIYDGETAVMRDVFEMKLPFALGFAVALTISATAALAHPALTKATPADKAVVTGSPAAISLTFSEAPLPKFSGVVVTDAAGKKVKLGTPAISAADKKQLVVPVAATLTPGPYKVDWFAVAGDTHRVTGKFSFTVK